MQIKIIDKRLLEMMPAYATDKSAGIDLRACIDRDWVEQNQEYRCNKNWWGEWTLVNPSDEDSDVVFTGITLLPHKTVLIPTGISINIDNPKLAAFLYPRSGLGHNNGIILGNSTGLIDADYQKQLFVSLYNRSNEPFLIEPMMRIAQMVIQPIERVEWEVVEEFSTISERGGFGSTGVK